MNKDQIKILDVKIDVISKKRVLDKIKDLLLSQTQAQLVTTNPEFIIAAQKDEGFKKIINNSWLSVADGYGIRLAAKYLDVVGTRHCSVQYGKTIGLTDRTRHCRVPTWKKIIIGIKVAWWGITHNNKKLDVITNVITGTDLVPEICHLLSAIPAKAGISWKIFLIGGYGNVPKLTAEKLMRNYHVETRHGASLKINYSAFEENEIIDKINKEKPQILFVALNHPRAQKWIDENLEKMPSVKLAIGVGGAFDYISGKIKRAPRCWRSLGLEWLYRLLRQPKRLKRIFTATVVFPIRVFRSKL